MPSAENFKSIQEQNGLDRFTRRKASCWKPAPLADWRSCSVLTDESYRRLSKEVPYFFNGERFCNFSKMVRAKYLTCQQKHTVRTQIDICDDYVKRESQIQQRVIVCTRRLRFGCKPQIVISFPFYTNSTFVVFSSGGAHCQSSTILAHCGCSMKGLSWPAVFRPAAHVCLYQRSLINIVVVVEPQLMQAKSERAKGARAARTLHRRAIVPVARDIGSPRLALLEPSTWFDSWCVFFGVWGERGDGIHQSNQVRGSDAISRGEPRPAGTGCVRTRTAPTGVARPLALERFKTETRREVAGTALNVCVWERNKLNLHIRAQGTRKGKACRGTFFFKYTRLTSTSCSYVYWRIKNYSVFVCSMRSQTRWGWKPRWTLAVCVCVWYFFLPQFFFQGWIITISFRHPLLPIVLFSI